MIILRKILKSVILGVFILEVFKLFSFIRYREGIIVVF